MVHVPFALGPAPRGDSHVLSLTTVFGWKTEGRSGTARDPVSELLPCRSLGLPVTVQVFFGLLAPAHTPETDRDSLRKEMAEIAKRRPWWSG